MNRLVRRYGVLAYVVSIVLATLLGYLLTEATNSVNAARLVCGALFVVASLYSIVAYHKLARPNGTVPALLAAQFVKSFLWMVGGIGFFVLAPAPPTRPEPSFLVELGYAIWVGWGWGVLCVGAFLYYGGEHGWLSTNVERFPWRVRRH